MYKLAQEYVKVCICSHLNIPVVKVKIGLHHCVMSAPVPT